MQLECSDQSLACSVGRQSTPSSVIGATVEGREILSAANGSAAVEDNGDTCLITTWTASASDVCAGSGSRLARGDGRIQLRGQPLSVSRATAERLQLRDRAFSRGLVHVVSGIGGSGSERLASQRRRAYRGPGSRTRKPVR
jgi:hypothetical protein